MSCCQFAYEAPPFWGGPVHASFAGPLTQKFLLPLTVSKIYGLQNHEIAGKNHEEKIKAAFSTFHVANRRSKSSSRKREEKNN